MVSQTLHHHNTCLVEDIYGDGDEEEGEDIGSGGDDGTYHEDDDEGVAAVAA